ncbi:MAG: hypothetical protein C4576_16280 [Desulfobacteraceae bacterium]|nr:MAG: hypothetical protein C4576_16280 [Desulfobacteraceae bacterium]
MKFNTKLIVFSGAMLVFVMAVSTAVVATIVTRQNRGAAFQGLRNSLEIVRDDLVGRQEKLLSDASQIAVMNGMGARINFLMDYKGKSDEIMTGTTYQDMTNDIYQIGKTSKIWKTAIYDSSGDLVSFISQKDEKSYICGYLYAGKDPVIKTAELKDGVTLKSDILKKSETLSDPWISMRFDNKIPDHQMVVFERSGPVVCLVAYSPVMGTKYNREKEEMENVQVGVAKALVRLESSFVEKMTRLTGMKINVFSGRKLSTGTLSEYGDLVGEKSTGEGAGMNLKKQAILTGTVEVNGEKYFQGLLSLDGHSAAIGAIAALHSQKIADANTNQMVRLLTLVALGCLALILPLCIFFARRLTKPIERAIMSLTHSAGEVSTAAALVSTNSQQLAEGASEQAASIEETSASLEEMASMTRQTADNSQQAAQFSKQATGGMADANVSMKALIRSMQETSAAGENVSKIIRTIDEIAFQTNLLALNAAVEAARAGQAGAGFAVVADEVRRLAMRSAEASRSTEDMVKEIIGKINQGSELVRQTDDKYRDAAVNIQKGKELVEGIFEAAEQQARGIEQVSKAVSEMDRVTQQNASGSEESASASESLSVQAREMHTIVEDLTSLFGVKNQKEKPDRQVSFRVQPAPCISPSPPLLQAPSHRTEPRMHSSS